MNEPYAILLVEDRADDVLFFERALQRTSFDHPLHTVTDGQKAIDYLSGADMYADRAAFPFPSLIILDLKTPRMGGFDVIQWMRLNPATKLTPIIVLSSSADPQDINRAYQLGANAFMVKPADHRALDRLLRTIGEFWLASETPFFGWRPSAATAML
jgi:CheY-like chemotaxis protein